ncbi:MAG: ATP-binding cassette domain-containing protein [Rhodoferax sp.]|nr:ATP-binding cassette domain-containing protein [Rhodoferax sp.]
MNKGVEFKNISKRYGTDKAASLAVDSISFEIPKGSLTTILGPSGCGKTTTLRMIAGLESPTSGQIIMDGKDVTTLGPAERNVSMMFQSYALFPPHERVRKRDVWAQNVRHSQRRSANQSQ